MAPTLYFVVASWCSFCQSLKGSRVIQKTRFCLRGSDVAVVNVDADRDPLMTKTLNVKAYPSIILVKDSGERLEYRGPRTADSICSWAAMNM